jgi:hypothetical protein
MANEFTPELDAKILEALQRKIDEDTAQKMAAARGEAVTRGIAGSSFEANRVGSAERGGQAAKADALVQLAIQNATRQREERLINEDRDFQVRQTTAQQTFQALEAEKQRAFQAGQTERAAQIEAQQAQIQRDFEDSQNRRANRQSLINTGLNAGGTLVGMGIGNKLFNGGGAAGGSSLFGGGATSAPVAGGTRLASVFGSTQAVPVAGAPAAAGGGGALSLLPMAGLAGAGLVAQNQGAKFVSGTLGKAAGTVTKALGPAAQVTGAIAGGVKKLFCFDANTPITMADGSTKRIADIQLGDNTKGGLVDSIRISLTDDGTVFNYLGVVVTGSHAVKENGVWKRVEDTVSAEPIAGQGKVYSLVTSDHRIWVNGYEFADEHEHDDYEYLSMAQSLKLLNLRDNAVGVI